MIDVERTVRRELDRLVPRTAVSPDWPEVVARARVLSAPRRRRRRLTRVAPFVVAAAALSVLVLAWPFGGGSSGSVLERAAAAIGDGPVVHVVIQDGFGGTLVDLASGARSQIHQQDEIWYDPGRGVHEVETFGGVVQENLSYTLAKVTYFQRTLGVLATGYVKSLQDGTARLLGPGRVNGQPVYWIRVDTQWLPDSSDGRLHEWAHDVAVSQDTYKPVATRETRDGQLSPDGLSMILEIETLPAGSGAITGADQTGSVQGPFRTVPPAPVDADGAKGVLGTDALWAGQRVAGLDLAGVWKTETDSGYDRSIGTWAEKHSGVMLFYGHLDSNTAIPGRVGVPDPATPFVEISESPTLFEGFQRGVANYSPPQGSLLIIGGRLGLMQAGGLHLALEGSSEDLLLAAARALAPMPS
jgi:hypothetical protein